MNCSIKTPETDLDELRRLRDNLKWISYNYDDLKNQFYNQYVAVKEKMVVDCDANHDLLVKRLQIQDYTDSIAIEYIYNT